MANSCDPLTQEQIYKGLYGVFKDGRYGNVNFCNISNESDMTAGLNMALEELKTKLKKLADLEFNNEQRYIQKLRQNLLTNNLILDDNALNQLDRALNSNDSSQYGIAYNILENIRTGQLSERIHTLKEGLNQVKELNNTRYNDVTVKQEVFNLILNYDITNSNIDDLMDYLQTKLESKYANDKLYVNTVKDYIRSFKSQFLKAYKLSGQDYLTELPSISSSFNKKVAGRTINEAIQSYASGVIQGMFLEYFKKNQGYLKTGTIQKTGYGLDKSKSQFNADVDNLLILNGNLEIDTNFQSWVDEGTHSLEEINEQLDNLYKDKEYFRVEMSAKAYSSGSMKIKGGGAFKDKGIMKYEGNLNTRLNYLISLGKALNIEEYVDALNFALVNNVPGFRYDDISLATFSNLIASLSFAYMFDINQNEIIDYLNSSLNLNHNLIHLYNIGGNYFPASNILYAIYHNLEMVQNTHAQANKVIDVQISHNGTTVDSVKQDAKNLIDWPHSSELDRWNAVRAVLTGMGSKSANQARTTIGIRLKMTELNKIFDVTLASLS